jgi:adenosylhomocysteine nucleosidase
VGVVAALGIEVAPFVAGLKAVRKYKGPRATIIEGELGKKLVAIVVSGVGRRLARRGAELLLAGHRPRWVVSAGFAGALDPSLQRNDVFLASELIDLDGGLWTVDVNIQESTSATDGSKRGPYEMKSGRLLTVDSIVRTMDRKADLAREHQARAVDMESSAVAAFCSERGLRFLSVSIVSDDARSDLPPEILSIAGGSQGFRLGAAFGAVLRRPSCVGDLHRLFTQAQSSAERLALVLREALAQLP